VWNVERRRGRQRLMIYKQISASLTAHLTTSLPPTGLTALSSLSTLSTTLNSPSSSAQDIISTVTSLTLTSQTQTQTLLRLSHLQRRLETQLQTLRSALYELRGTEFQGSRELVRQTAEWNRNVKQLRSKVQEYEDRLSTIPQNQAQNTPPSMHSKRHSRTGSTLALEGRNKGEASLIEEVVRREKRVLELGEKVKELEEQVQAFKGLPRDKEEARREVERVLKEVAALKEKRDRLFEGLVGG
jgi:HAUS augmin-like complex subunit 1